MTYTTRAIAGAIASIVDQAIEEQKISDSDGDSMARVAIEAEEMVANQLIRAGMALQEAKDRAAEAALLPGAETSESKELAADAFRNRYADVPNGSEGPSASVVPGEQEGQDGDQGIEAASQDEVEAETAEIETTVESRGAVAPRTKRVPVKASTPIIRREPVQIPFQVTKKKAHELFKCISEGDADFDFDLPFLNWDRAHPNIPKIDPHYMFDTTHLHTLLYAVMMGVSVNLVGPHGSGKTEMVKQMAARMNFPVTILPMDGQLSRRELIGKEKLQAGENGTNSYFEMGLLPRALMEPGFILFDELDRGVSDLQYACHSVYLQEGLRILEDEGRFIPFHEYNRVFGTSNTKGRGSLDGMYQPPEEMSEATRDRWSLWVDVGYADVESDTLVLIHKVPGLEKEHAKVIAEIAEQIRSAYTIGKMAQTCSMRQQLEVARKTQFLCRDEKDDVRREKALRHAFDRVISGRASPEDKGAIDTLLSAKIPQAFTGTPLFA